LKLRIYSPFNKGVRKREYRLNLIGQKWVENFRIFMKNLSLIGHFATYHKISSHVDSPRVLTHDLKEGKS